MKLEIYRNDDQELSGEINGIYFVFYKPLNQLAPASEFATIALVEQNTALHSLLKEAGEALGKFSPLAIQFSDKELCERFEITDETETVYSDEKIGHAVKVGDLRRAAYIARKIEEATATK